jgi:uncharacterized protein YoxC
MAIDIRLYFDCTNNKTFVKDLTDYTTEIPTGVQVIGYGTLSAPNSTLIINDNSIGDPIIANDVTPRVSALYNLTSPIQAGQYTFNYTNYYIYFTVADDSQFIRVLTNNSILVEGEIASLFKAGDSIVITDSAESANNGTFTVVSLTNEFGYTTIVIEENTLVPLDPVANDPYANFSITTTQAIHTNKIYTYSACSSSPTPCVEFSYDCFTGAYGSGQITDATNYNGYTVETRELSAYYPNALSPVPAESPVVTETAIINIGELATGTWSVKLSSTVSSAQADGLNLQSTITTLKEFNVACSSNMCGLSDCLTKLKDKHISYLKSSNISPLQQYVDNVQLLYTMAKEAQACGDKNAYSDYVSQIYAVLKKTESECGCSTGSSCGCGCESSGSCGCGDQTPQWVNNIGVDIDSLLAEFETFMTETLPTLEADIDSLNNDMQAVQESITLLQDDVDALNSGLSTVTTQTGSNTTSIEQLDEQINGVNGLADQVSDLEQQIAEFSPSNSEISINESFNKLSTPSQGVWKCVEGLVLGDVTYKSTIQGDVSLSFPSNQMIYFYNPPTQSWFEGQVTNATYDSGANQTYLTIDCGLGTITKCDFLDSVDTSNNPLQYPLFISSNSSLTSTYNFRKSFVLSNDSYWKYDDATHIYWSKLNISFACNQDLDITLSNTTNPTYQSIPIRARAGMFFDIEFTFEKQYISGDDYDLAFVADVKYSGGLSSMGVDTTTDPPSAVYSGRYGYNPSFSYGIDLNNVSGFPEGFGGNTAYNSGCILTQDVYKYYAGAELGDATNSSREVFRYAFGPSFPDNTVNPPFKGDAAETIIFNFLNTNITIFKFEQSFGKFLAPAQP